MKRVITRISMAALCVTALVGVSAVAPAEAKTSRHAHATKHRWHQGHHYVQSGPRYGGSGWAATSDWRSDGVYDPICPAVGHSFDCKIWPPPYDVDPDRKIGRP